MQTLLSSGFALGAVNETAGGFLGETPAAWLIAAITTAATIFLGVAALKASQRANDIAGMANKIAADAREDSQRLAQQQWVEAQLRELDALIREMAKLAAQNPIPATETDGAEVPQIPPGVLSALQAYGANMGAAREIERRLRERGYSLSIRAAAVGRRGIFQDYEFQELERHRHVLMDAARDAKSMDQATLEALGEYWNGRWFNLPVVAGVERIDSNAADSASASK